MLLNDGGGGFTLGTDLIGGNQNSDGIALGDLDGAVTPSGLPDLGDLVPNAAETFIA